MQLDDPAERDAWIERMAERLASTFEGRVEPERVRALLGRLADLEVDRPKGDMTPGQAILQWLIEEQGFDSAAAGMAARIIPTIDWHAIELTNMEMAKALGMSRVTLWRHRGADGIPTHAVLREGTRDIPVFRFSSLLYILAWQRRHPWRGGGQGSRAYPPTRLH